MTTDPLQVLRAGRRGPMPKHALAGHVPVLLVGGGGLLGRALLERLAARGGAQVPVRTALRVGLAGVLPLRVPQSSGDSAATDFTAWPRCAARTAVVQFDTALHGSAAGAREGAFWTPRATDLPGLGRWLRSQGVQTLCVVLPHDQGRLPEALKRGLASLDEHTLATLGFARLLLVRTARAPAAQAGRSAPERLAAAMLGIFGYMVPGASRPVRAAKVAEVVDALLAAAPSGVHVVAPEAVSAAAQGAAADTAATVASWFALATPPLTTAASP